MVTAMDAFERSPGHVKSFSRRQALWLAGAAGIGVVASSCGTNDEAPTAESAPSERSPVPSAPGTQAAPPEPPAPTATQVPLLCRESWGAQPPLPGGRPHTINRMTIHHTAVHLGDNSNAPARLRQHQAYHQKQHGWIDIAYHVSVDRNGNIYQLRAPELAGDTATQYDPWGHFLVVCEGNFDEEVVSEAQLNSAAMAFAWASRTFNVSPETLGGHRDASPDTACPGEDLYSYVTSGVLKKRVNEFIAAGGVELRTICGPEASAIVDDIEAGTQQPKG